MCYPATWAQPTASRPTKSLPRADMGQPGIQQTRTWGGGGGGGGRAVYEPSAPGLHTYPSPDKGILSTITEKYVFSVKKKSGGKLFLCKKMGNILQITAISYSASG